MRWIMRIAKDIRLRRRGQQRVLMLGCIDKIAEMQAVAARQMVRREGRTLVAVCDVRNRVEPETDQCREQSSSQPSRRCTDPMEHVHLQEQADCGSSESPRRAPLGLKQTNWTCGMCEEAKASPPGALGAPGTRAHIAGVSSLVAASRGRGVPP